MNIDKEAIGAMPLRTLLERYPFTESFFENNNLDITGAEGVTFWGFLESLDDEALEDRAVDRSQVIGQLCEFIDSTLEFLGEDAVGVQSMSIYPGTNKFGEDEGFEKLVVNRGEVVSIVGPTGSGKSRLLADIEWVAQRDTPTNRLVHINDREPEKKWRFSIEDKLVAQLSQNMNFVMDLSVYEFVRLHARSRMIEDEEGIVNAIIEQANSLAGEGFVAGTPITSLSGGQSRALMIADTAILSKSPVVLIDEIENAGVDRKKCLALLLSEEKIVLIATHDPTLALLGDRRIVIKHGGIYSVIKTTDMERSVLGELEAMDKRIHEMRRRLREGEELQMP